jgi:serine/threonine-protein kinase
MRTLAWVDRTGHEEPLSTPARAYLHPRVSPDGTHVAVSIEAVDDEVWVWDIARETLQRVASELPLTAPNWMPDGTRLVAASGRAGNFNLYSVHADGTAGAERLTDSPNAQLPTGLTPNGSHVLFWERMPDGRRDLKSVMPVGRQVQTLLQGAYSHRNGVVSPDGTWMAYEADSAGPGRLEIYVRPFPAVERGQWLVSAGRGGTRPVWARNGRELFYIAPDGALMVVSVDPHGGTWRANRPERLLAPGYYTLAGGDFSRSYDVSRDGRFLMVKSGDESRATDARIVVVRNWFEELKRLVPTK